MFVSKLPPKPDFDVLAAAAPASADRRTHVLALIGNLICSWSNNESLFIYVLMILLRTEEAAAAVVFATLNTTRARLDLIQRLAKIRITDRALSKSLPALIERFSDRDRRLLELAGRDGDLFAAGQDARLAAAYRLRAHAVAYRGASAKRR